MYCIIVAFYLDSRVVEKLCVRVEFQCLELDLWSWIFGALGFQCSRFRVYSMLIRCVW